MVDAAQIVGLSCFFSVLFLLTLFMGVKLALAAYYQTKQQFSNQPEDQSDGKAAASGKAEEAGEQRKGSGSPN